MVFAYEQLPFGGGNIEPQKNVILSMVCGIGFTTLEVSCKLSYHLIHGFDSKSLMNVVTWFCSRVFCV